jgi:predicted DNA-binding transcriptional regulator YafY
VFFYADREGKRSERRAEPYRLVTVGRRWYLFAFDLDRRDWRTFRIDRITAAQRSGHRFVPVEPPDAARMVGEAITTAPYRYQAVVRFEVPAATLARRVPPMVGVVRPLSPGSELTVGANDLDALAGHLVWLGLPFEVVSPPELRAHVHGVGLRLARAHEGATG